MVIKDYVLDKERSLEMFETHRKALNQGACYNNVFSLCNEYDMVRGTMKVAYGYWSAFPGIMARHCFFVTDDKKILDPTFGFRSNKEDEVSYWIFAILDFRDYLDMLREDDLQPGLHAALWEREKELAQGFEEHKTILIN